MSMVTLKYNQTGDKRLPFVKAIAEILGVKPKYTGVPRCAYIIDFVTVNREGNIEVDSRVDNAKRSSLMQKLTARGYTAEKEASPSDPLPQAVEERIPSAQMNSLQASETMPENNQSEEEQPIPSSRENIESGTIFDVSGQTEDANEITDQPQTGQPAENEPSVSEPPQTEQAAEAEPVGTTISVPRDIFTDLGLENLKKILWAKGELICQALDISSTDIEVTDETVNFPWFGELDADEIKHISQFISGLCEFANTSKRITSKQRKEGNPKFAMRTWAIRLGFNGAEYKGLRAFLMKRLPGDAAWRFGKPENDLPTEPRLPINVQVIA